MTWESWLGYVLAYAAISVIPGPSVLMIISQSLTRGRRAALICIAGDLAGGLIVMSAAYLGVGLVLAASSLAFALLKWAGVAYLAYLGCAQILTARSLAEGAVEIPRRDGRSFRAGFLTGVLNPKAILFYMAFLSQFIVPEAPRLPQFLILMASSTVIVALVLGGYAMMATMIGARLRSAQARRHVGYASGACLLGGSGLLAVTR
ncbi:LysE family translocator [Sedimentimonas flavescens]|uniref:LysE family translocator n=1 Tax=Sedimentimonas flavescens TaxID=2851012 RepID=UPI0021A4C1DD|nr:LysE family translocator [Sedimentimonas flavescens]MCT2540031.1 LysE family translocator [Sedimentimonas flavescens]